MSLGLKRSTILRAFLAIGLLCALAIAVPAQDRSDWQSLQKLQPGDSIRMALKTGPVKGTFRSWTPQQVTAGTATAKKEDVLQIDRIRPSGWGRGKKALLGALIGFGGGFAVGAASAGCNSGSFGPCITRFGGGLIVGGAGAVVGAGIGALLPRRHTTELIYSTK